MPRISLEDTRAVLCSCRVNVPNGIVFGEFVTIVIYHTTTVDLWSSKDVSSAITLRA